MYADLIIHAQRFGLARKHVTVSTVGCTPGMRRLTKEAPGVHLAVSLHAPNQVLRNEIVPSARAFHLDSILDAMDKHICTAGPNSKRKQRGFIEYIVIHGVNDSEDCAHQLGELLGSRDVIVNLIPYNASTADEMFKEPPEHQVQQVCFALYRLVDSFLS
jgi:adenine C2-methylase RlmN of 23S rRNA A2503 and tRNA A37